MRCKLTCPPDFAFTSAVCSHGFFMLAPNRWDPANTTLHTHLNVDDNRCVPVAIRADGRRAVQVESKARVSPAQRTAILGQVRRVLRLDEDLSRFHALCRGRDGYRPAARGRFGRLLRSATLFEDMVKVICTCNVAWRQTTAMVEKLIACCGVPDDGGRPRGFPTPRRLAAVPATRLRAEVRVGYRAEFIHRLAGDVVAGRLDLDAIERFAGAGDDPFRTLKKIHGIGDYAAANLCMLLGRYDRLAIDTELIRHVRTHHPHLGAEPAAIRAHYDAWQPFAFLAYWYELWSGYARTHGAADSWSPETTGARITEA